MAQSKSYYQAYDDRYRQIHEQSLHWFSEAPSPIVLEIMNKYQVSKASAILEIGCGEGRDAAYLLQNSYPVLATDVSTEAVKYCRKQFPEYADSFQVLDCLTERLSEHMILSMPSPFFTCWLKRKIESAFTAFFMSSCRMKELP